MRTRRVSVIVSMIMIAIETRRKNVRWHNVFCSVCSRLCAQLYNPVLEMMSTNFMPAQILRKLLQKNVLSMLCVAQTNCACAVAFTHSLGCAVHTHANANAYVFHSPYV